MTEVTKSNEQVEDAKKEEVSVKNELANKTIKERSEIKSVSNKEQNIKVTETDGTVIDVNIKAPGLRGLEEIDAKRSVLVGDSGEKPAVRFTPVDLHESLFTLFNTPLVNSKPTDESIGWDFFDKHERATYNFMMETADTFLTNLS